MVRVAADQQPAVPGPVTGVQGHERQVVEARSLRAGSSRVARPAVLAETGGDLVEASHRLTKRLDSARQVSKDLTLVLEASAAVRSGVRTEERT